MKALHATLAATVNEGLSQLAGVQGEAARHYGELVQIWGVLVRCQYDIDLAVAEGPAGSRFSRARVEAIQVAAARLPRHLERANRELRAVKRRVGAARVALARAQRLRAEAWAHLPGGRPVQPSPTLWEDLVTVFAVVLGGSTVCCFITAVVLLAGR